MQAIPQLQATMTSNISAAWTMLGMMTSIRTRPDHEQPGRASLLFLLCSSGAQLHYRHILRLELLYDAALPMGHMTRG
jgi:hypothetical protein